MWKIWVSLVVVTSVALYFVMGGEDSTDSKSQPPTATSEAARPAGAALGLAVPRTPPQAQPHAWGQGRAYRQPAPTADTAWMYGIYPAPQAYSPQSAPTQDYRFRPLTQSEKSKLEEGSVSIPPVVTAEPAYRGGPSDGYPASGYAASGYPNVAFPGAVYPTPMERQGTPTPTYKFRELDSEKASKRWTGDYPPPSQAMPPATLPDQSSPYAPGWSPPSPYQSRPLTNEGPLWAAGGMTP